MSEIIVVFEKEKRHIFYDIYNYHENTYCIVKIKVKKFYYKHDIYLKNVKHYYEITYTYYYVIDGKEILHNTDYNQYSIFTMKNTNPFYYYRNKICDDSLEGVIAFSNRVTNTLIEQLLMDDDELELELSNTSIVQYRSHLMYTLSTFWD